MKKISVWVGGYTANAAVEDGDMVIRIPMSVPATPRLLKHLIDSKPVMRSA